jgi:hypothetical protein
MRTAGLSVSGRALPNVSTLWFATARRGRIAVFAAAPSARTLPAEQRPVLAGNALMDTAACASGAV